MMSTLRELRKEKGLSQKDMAKKIDYSLSSYQKIESGKKKPGRKFMNKIKLIFPDVSIDRLFFN